MIKRFLLSDFPRAHVECDDVVLPFYHYVKWYRDKCSFPFVYGKDRNDKDFVLLGGRADAHSTIVSDFYTQLNCAGCGTRHKLLCARVFENRNSLSPDVPNGFITAWTYEAPNGYTSSHSFGIICDLLAKQNVKIENYSIVIECRGGVVLENEEEDDNAAVYEVKVSDYIRMGLSSLADIPAEFERQEKKKSASYGGGKPSWHDLPYRLYRWQSDESKDTSKDMLNESIVKFEADFQTGNKGYIYGCEISIPQWNVKMDYRNHNTIPFIYMVGPDGKDHVFVGDAGLDHSDIFGTYGDEIWALGREAYKNMLKCRIYSFNGISSDDANMPPGLLTFWYEYRDVDYTGSKNVKRMVELLKNNGIDISGFSVGTEIITNGTSFYNSTSALFITPIKSYVSLSLSSVHDLGEAYEREQRKMKSIGGGSNKPSWHDLPYRLYRWQSDEGKIIDVSKETITEIITKCVNEILKIIK